MAKEKFEKIDLESGSFETTVNKMYESREPWKPVNIKDILSFMPGTVEKLNVKKGAKVKKGEPLMVFRAMKMSNVILAPLDGKIKAVNVKVGENLPKNVVMIEME